MRIALGEMPGGFCQVERFAEYCWNDTVWNLEFDETVPCCCSRMYKSIEARDTLFESTNIDEVSNIFPPTSHRWCCPVVLLPGGVGRRFCQVVLLAALLGKGQMGSALIGSLHLFILFDRGTFWVLPLTYFYIPRSVRAYLFPQSVNIHYFCSGPIRVVFWWRDFRVLPSNVCTSVFGKHMYTCVYLSLSLYIYIYIYIVHIYNIYIDTHTHTGALL